MEATLSDAAGRERVNEAIARQAEHFDMPGLQLGFCYEAGALARSGADEPPALDVRRYRPSGCPGARLPHAWLADGASLLDRVPLDRFLLLAGPDGDRWIEALAQASGPPAEGLRLSAAALPELDRWLASAGIGPAGAMWIRPDQHVAWRSSGPVDDPAAALTQAMRTILHG
jgi:2,4-dichlorophenol 6-monooxygenase